MAHFLWTWSWVSFGNVNCFFGQNGVFRPKTQQFGLKNMKNMISKTSPNRRSYSPLPQTKDTGRDNIKRSQTF